MAQVEKPHIPQYLLEGIEGAEDIEFGVTYSVSRNRFFEGFDPDETGRLPELLSDALREVANNRLTKALALYVSGDELCVIIFADYGVAFDENAGEPYKARLALMSKSFWFSGIPSEIRRIDGKTIERGEQEFRRELAEEQAAFLIGIFRFSD